jgi:hypothetical protein
MYNPESIKRCFKHKRRLKSLYILIECLLNQSPNKYNKDTIYIKIIKKQFLIFFTYLLNIVRLKVRT